MIKSFPKIFTLGDKHIIDIFKGEVEVSEKVDGCVTYESLVTLADGSKRKIGEIVNNRLNYNVLSYNKRKKTIEIKKIKNWFKNGKSNDWIKIKVKGFRGQWYSLKCTKNHRIMIENKGWLEAKNINVGDNVLMIDFCLSSIIKREVIEIDNNFIPNNTYKYDLEIEDNHNFFINNILVHNSQLNFGKYEDKLLIRSKRILIDPDNPDKMFLEGVEYIKSIEHLIPNNNFFHCEYLKRPKHNVLSYNRIPKNHLIMFGMSHIDKSFYSYNNFKLWADKFEIEAIPILFKGYINNIEELFSLLEKESILGGPKIEGIVVKNYNLISQIGNIYFPLACGKYVSEKFKEKNQKDWKKEHTRKDKFKAIRLQYKTKARWLKAIQHLKDLNLLENSPKDIGKLLKEIKSDIIKEEKENIMEELWKLFSDDILRTSIHGFPEFYKEYLAKGVFKE